jgi:hypothetical protein
MATPKSKQIGFDLQALNAMQEPIAIRIERLDRYSGSKEPISLPQMEWSKEDAQKIEQIILHDISGGGSYEGQMSDSSGKSFTWKFAYPEQQYPRKLAPGVAAPQPQAQNGNGSLSGAPVGTVWQPPAVPRYQPPPPQSPFYGASPYMSPYQSPPYGGNPYYQPPTAPTPAASGPSDEIKQMREALDAERRARQEEQHRREREQAEARHAAEMAELRRSMDKLSEKPKRGDDDPVLMELKRQNEALQAEIARQREETQRREAEHRIEQQRLADQTRTEQMRRDQENAQREADRRFEQIMAAQAQAQREMQAQILAMQQQSQQQMQAMQQQMQQSANGPMATMLAEMQRESSRLAQEQSRAATEAPMRAMDMARMFKELSGGDRLVTQLADAYGGVQGMMMRTMEFAKQMLQQDGGSPGWQMLSEGMHGAQEILGKFVESKNKSEMAAHRAQQAHAQAQAMQAQAQAMSAQAEMMKGQAPPEDVAQAQAQATEAEKVAGEAQAEAQTAAEAAKSAKQLKVENEKRIFGPAYEEIVQMRGILKEQGEDQIEPKSIAMGVMMGAEQIRQANLSVPAFDLLNDQRYADLVDYMIPDASADYRGAVAAELETLVKEVEVGNFDPSEVGNDNDADDDDEG